MQINNFYSKQTSFAHNTNSNDYAYQLLKNPDMAKTKTERNFIRSFNLITHTGKMINIGFID